MRVTLATGQNEAANPRDVALLCAHAAMLDPQPLPHWMQEPRWSTFDRCYTPENGCVSHTPLCMSDNTATLNWAPSRR